jgi:hypothetical protein
MEEEIVSNRWTDLKGEYESSGALSRNLRSVNTAESSLGRNSRKRRNRMAKTSKGFRRKLPCNNMS